MNVLECTAIGISATFVVARFCGFKNNVYKDAAHIWVGAMLYGWLVDGNPTTKFLAIGMSVAELMAFGVGLPEKRGQE